MPAKKRIKTKYCGVYYIMSISRLGRPERVYYVTYKKDGKAHEEPVGRQYEDDMTPARARDERWMRIKGLTLPNKEKRRRHKWTVDAVWQEFQRLRPELKLREEIYRYDKHIKPDYGAKAIHALMPMDFDRLRVKLKPSYAPATIKNVLELLRRLVRFARQRKLCEIPEYHVTMPKVDNEKTEDLTPEQLSRLVDVLHKTSNYQVANMMLLALYTGMRRGELMNLRWDDIDTERGFIVIRKPKGGKTISIPLNDAAGAVLEQHPYKSSAYVFPGWRGRRRQEVNIAARKIRDEAGLPKDFRPFHGLRHVFASILASSGQVDIYTIQRLLTHKNAAMTQRYAHLRDDALRKASQLVGDIVKKTSNNSA